MESTRRGAMTRLNMNIRIAYYKKALGDLYIIKEKG